MRGLVFVGRWFISAIFIILSVSSFFHLDEINNEYLQTLSVWQMSMSNVLSSGDFLVFLEDTAKWVVLFGILLQLGGALLIFLQYRVKLGATLLLCYLFCSTIFNQPFWFFEGPMLARSFVLFMKNFAIIGGLLFILSERTGVSMPSTGH